jgi:hypothetical protein
MTAINFKGALDSLWREGCLTQVSGPTSREFERVKGRSFQNVWSRVHISMNRDRWRDRVAGDKLTKAGGFVSETDTPVLWVS